MLVKRRGLRGREEVCAGLFPIRALREVGNKFVLRVFTAHGFVNVLCYCSHVTVLQYLPYFTILMTNVFETVVGPSYLNTTRSQQRALREQDTWNK